MPVIAQVLTGRLLLVPHGQPLRAGAFGSVSSLSVVARV